MSVLCPQCFEQTAITLKASLVREEMTCSNCNFFWTERSKELKQHKNERLTRLEKVEDALQLKYLELQNSRVCATINILWSKRL